MQYRLIFKCLFLITELQHKSHYKQLTYFFRSKLHIGICRKGEGERDDDTCITTFILVLHNRIQVCNGYSSMKMLLHTCHNFNIIGASKGTIVPKEFQSWNSKTIIWVNIINHMMNMLKKILFLYHWVFTIVILININVLSLFKEFF